jgi:hypothetical protein
MSKEKEKLAVTPDSLKKKWAPKVKRRFLERIIRECSSKRGVNRSLAEQIAERMSKFLESKRKPSKEEQGEALEFVLSIFAQALAANKKLKKKK